MARPRIHPQCPHCGQPMTGALPPVKERIYAALSESPRTAEELRRIVGTFHPRFDNPVSEWTIYSHLSQLRKLLKQRGQDVKNDGLNQPYRLVPL